MPKIGIGFIGGMGSGKTTVARRLEKEFDFELLALATPIKDICKQYFNIQDKHDPRARYAYQTVGDTLRKVDKLVWIRQTTQRHWEHSRLGSIVEDCRYPNEVASLGEGADFYFIYLKVPLRERIRRLRERDCPTENRLKHALRVIKTLFHPSELLVPSAVRTAKRMGRLATIDASRSPEEVWEEVYFHVGMIRDLTILDDTLTLV